MGLLDLLFPKLCVGCGKLGSYICVDCLTKVQPLEHQFCSECGKNALLGITHPGCLRPLGLDGLTCLFNYTTPIKEIVRQLKYHFVSDLITEVKTKLDFKVQLTEDTWLLLPIPLSTSRQNFRGFNQTEELGKVVSDKLGLIYNHKILERVVHNRPQVGLSRRERQSNVAKIFQIKQTVNAGSFVIFDDVWTSGATIKSAAKVLKRAGAKKVWGLAFASAR